MLLLILSFFQYLFIEDAIINITNIFFSPSGTTKKVVEILANNFEEEKSICDLLYFDDNKQFNQEDLVIVAMPVFAGRIPKTANNRLSKLTGDDTKAIAIVNYGNANVDDALIELVDLLKENNFNVIAAASTVSHHSLFNGVAIGRPDESDVEKINDFAKKCCVKLENNGFLQAEIPGNGPYVDYATLPFELTCNNSCTFCNVCILFVLKMLFPKIILYI